MSIMKIRVYILLIIIFSPLTIFCQSKFRLLDIETNKSIQFATILNKSSSSFTFTDELGEFNLPIKSLDSLIITHVSYVTKKILIDNSVEHNIYLKEKLNDLNEVIIKNNVPTQIELNRDMTFYGLSLDREYAIFINGGSELNGKILTEIILPIKNKKNYSTDGILEISIVSADINNNLTDNLIIDPIYFKTNLLKEKISFKIPKNKVLYFENNYFIVIKRIATNKVYNKKGLNTSVNPFIEVIKSVNGKKIYVKDTYNNRWIEITKKNYPFVPLFNLKFIYEK